MFVTSANEVLLSTNGSCQLSEGKQELNQTVDGNEVKGLPLPSVGLVNSTNSTYYVGKARKTRVTSSKRQTLNPTQNAECDNQAIVKTEDFGVSEEDYQKMQEGGVAIIRGDETVRGCREYEACTGVGPIACGYSGWYNPFLNPPRNISAHQVSISNRTMAKVRSNSGQLEVPKYGKVVITWPRVVSNWSQSSPQVVPKLPFCRP